MILSRQDLSNPENAKDCAHELRGLLDNVIDRMDDMATAVRLSDWVAKWGEGIIGQLENPDVDNDDLERAYVEATDAEAKVSHLTGAIENAVNAMDDAAELPSERRAAEFDRIASDLEKALSE